MQINIVKPNRIVCGDLAADAQEDQQPSNAFRHFHYAEQLPPLLG